MRKLTLTSLTLDNFKGCRHLSLDFGGRNATLYGDNAAGKTTVYDALTWLLFGKDSLGRGDFEIKPLAADGSVLNHAAITSVEAILTTEAGSIRLRKEYYEKWSTKRGSINKTFDGNTCDHYVDGVPCKKYEYEEKMAELVDEKVFRLLTSTTYFCSTMSWQDRRALLFKLCGTASDDEIMAQDDRFAPLAAALCGLSMEDYRKKLQAERRGYNTSRETVPVRLDECRKTLADLDGIDFGALRSEVDTRTRKRDELAAELLKLEHNTLLDDKRNQRGDLKNQLAQLENENTAYRQSQSVPPQEDGTYLRAELERQKRAIILDTDAKKREDDLIASLTDKVNTCRALWLSIKAETFHGENCPACNQPLTGAQLEKATARYEEDKTKRLAGVVEESEFHKGAISAAKFRREAAIERVVAAENKAAELRDKLAAIRPAEACEISDMDGYGARRAALEHEISSLDREIIALAGESQTIRSEVQGKIRELDNEISAINGTIAKEAVIISTQQRMEALREDAKRAAEQMEAIDAQLYLCDEFVRFKAKFTEASINSRFRLIQFKLFDPQVNGGLSECCDPMVDGVPYSSLNNGARINAGLDVINTMSEFYKTHVPLFVDNAESVTRLLSMDTQVIRLVVSPGDKELRCEYEDQG